MLQPIRITESYSEQVTWYLRHIRIMDFSMNQKLKSGQGPIFYYPKNVPTTPLNGAVLTMAQTIKSVMASAAEA